MAVILKICFKLRYYFFQRYNIYKSIYVENFLWVHETWSNKKNYLDGIINYFSLFLGVIYCLESTCGGSHWKWIVTTKLLQLQIIPSYHQLFLVLFPRHYYDLWDWEIRCRSLLLTISAYLSFVFEDH